METLEILKKIQDCYDTIDDLKNLLDDPALKDSVNNRLIVESEIIAHEIEEMTD